MLPIRNRAPLRRWWMKWNVHLHPAAQQALVPGLKWLFPRVHEIVVLNRDAQRRIEGSRPDTAASESRLSQYAHLPWNSRIRSLRVRSQTVLSKRGSPVRSSRADFVERLLDDCPEFRAGIDGGSVNENHGAA